MSKRQCKGTNKAGEPCKSAPLKGQLVCVAHNTSSPIYKDFFAPGHPNHSPGRPPKISDRQMLETAIRERADELLTLAFAGLQTGDAFRYLQLLLAYAFGQPPRAVEISGPGGGPVTIAGVWAEAHDELTAVGG